MGHFNAGEVPQLDEVMRVGQQWPALKAARPDAVNTTVGVMYDPDLGTIWRPQTLRQADFSALADTYDNYDFGYQTQQGHQPYLQAVGRLAFGDTFTLTDDTVAIQTNGGTGALAQASYQIVPAQERGRLGYTSRTLYLDDGWPNYRNPVTFGSAFARIRSFPRSYDSSQNHQKAMELLDANVRKDDVVLSQAAGYNDDGIDWTPRQIDERLGLIAERGALHIIDAPYMGLANGWEADRYMLQQSVERGIGTLVTLSASKNMGLYNGRLGALFVFNEDPVRVTGRLQTNVRGLDSNAALDKAKTVATMLADSEMQVSYMTELEIMRQRLLSTRQEFAAVLGPEYSHVRDGRGLFTKLLATAFTAGQLAYLKNEHGILALSKTRVNLGGIPAGQAGRVAEAFKAALKLTA